MIPRMPDPDDYYHGPNADLAHLQTLDYVTDLLRWIQSPKTPVWITGGAPTYVFAAIEAMKSAELLLVEARSNFAAEKNAASCQNAAPRLPETTEPQAL